MRWTLHGPRALILSATAGLAVLLGSGIRHLEAQGKGGKDDKPPLVIEKQGSLFAGGTVITTPGTFDPTNPTTAGQTLHADHVYTRYEIPPNARNLPLVMWHGCLSTAWESTPDDREGYESIFVRRGWSVYIIDQPRQGRSGKSSEGITIVPTPGDQLSFSSFRFGVWPNFFPGSLFPQGAASLDHFFRQGGAVHGPNNTNVSTDAVAALFARIGPGILVTHSASGVPGLLTAMKSPNIKGMVAYEPSSYIFPEGEVPPALPLSNGVLLSPGGTVPLSEFMKLTRFPIQMILGDNVPTSPNPVIALDNWRVRLNYLREMIRLINKYGGDATLLHLPEIGIHGNTHFAFTDLNNVQIADLMSKYLHEKGLDKRKDKEKDD
jgi:hypothetical protein